MNIINKIKQLRLSYDTNRIYINYSKTNYFVYNRDLDFCIVRAKKEIANSSFKTIRVTIKKLCEPKSSYTNSAVVRVLPEAFEEKFKTKYQYKGFISHILENNKDISVNDLVGVVDVRYNPEINCVNLITKEFLLMESTYYNEQSQLIVNDKWKSYVKGAYMDRLVTFQITSADFYINNCTAGLQKNTQTPALQCYKTMRLQTQMYPILMKFSNELSIPEIETKFNAPLIKNLLSNFNFTRTVETTSLYGKLIRDLDEHEKGYVVFTTKKEIAEFLELRTDFVDMQTLLRLFIGKYVSGFYSPNEKNYRIKYSVKEGQTSELIVYPNQLYTMICRGMTLKIEETLDSSEYYKKIAKDYLDSYTSLDSTLKAKATTDERVANRFGGLSVIRNPDVAKTLAKFEEVMA